MKNNSMFGFTNQYVIITAVRQTFTFVCTNVSKTKSSRFQPVTKLASSTGWSETSLGVSLSLWLSILKFGFETVSWYFIR